MSLQKTHPSDSTRPGAGRSRSAARIATTAPGAPAHAGVRSPHRRSLPRVRCRRCTAHPAAAPYRQQRNTRAEPHAIGRGYPRMVMEAFVTAHVTSPIPVAAAKNSGSWLISRLSSWGDFPFPSPRPSPLSSPSRSRIVTRFKVDAGHRKQGPSGHLQHSTV